MTPETPTSDTPMVQTDPWKNVEAAEIYDGLNKPWWVYDKGQADAAIAEVERQRAAEVKQLNDVIREHGTFGGLFQPGGRFYSAAKEHLLLGRSAVVEGGKWLVAEVDRARQTSEYWKAEHLAGNAEVERLRAQVQQQAEELSEQSGEYRALRYAWETEQVKAARLREALEVFVVLLDGQTEPLHPLSWQVELAQARAALEPVKETHDPA